jgi:hypothetical protein
MEWGVIRGVTISINRGDVLEQEADVLVLKHAQAFYGVDRVLATALANLGVPAEQITARPWKAVLTESRGTALSPRILFIGTPPLQRLTYSDIRKFGIAVVSNVCRFAAEARTVKLTLHGPGFGFDEIACAREFARRHRRGSRSIGTRLETVGSVHSRKGHRPLRAHH